MLIRWI